MWKLYLLVLYLASLSFGGGQILLSGLERELVQTGRLSGSSFAVAVALGQSTPGPLAAFTTGVGMAVAGIGGAIAATAALLTVSLIAVLLIARIPAGWFRLPRVQAGLTAVGPLVAALAFFIAIRSLQAVPLGIEAIAITAAVAVGKLYKLPTVALVLGAVALGMAAGGV